MNRLALALLALFLAAGDASAQAWPTKPVHFVIPFPPGSFADITMRILQQKLGPRLGQPIVVDNRSGASGDIGAEAMAKAAPDGYNFGVATNSTHGVSPALNPDLPYNAVKDFAMVSLIGAAPYVLITSPSLPAKSVKELIALAKSKPGGLTYASVGPASLAHLAGALFSQMADVKLTEVPYRTSAQSVLDTAEGRIDLQFGTMAPVLPQVLAGKVRALAVTSLKRAAVLPDIPTLDESGLPGFEASLWLAVVAPAKTPPDIVERMNRELKAVLTDPDVTKALKLQGIEASPTTPDELRARIEQDIAKWRKLAAETGITMDQK
ncbi:MAG TPA: tripartite tricarboxylate transporter substrate binding protein [Xanthobacteraceae bacterium]|jgi:tripartite-type tricarboxylate transporter receptor subunit TctC